MEPKDASIDELMGQTIASIEAFEGGEEVVFTLQDGRKLVMCHHQDCCERVTVEDICGDLADLLGYPVVLAEESSSNKNPPGVNVEYQDSFTWTFYSIGTAKGCVTIRWYGSSNGYYSESVNCEWRQ